MLNKQDQRNSFNPDDAKWDEAKKLYEVLQANKPVKFDRDTAKMLEDVAAFIARFQPRMDVGEFKARHASGKLVDYVDDILEAAGIENAYEFMEAKVANQMRDAANDAAALESEVNVLRAQLAAASPSAQSTPHK